jgi:cytoskeletal protein CcmA (bactofilin family)
MKFIEAQISIINRDCRLEGQLYFKGHLIVEGTVDGSIYGESIFTERDSHTTAKVHAKSFTIAGFFEGEIEVDMLTLLKTANVEGHIRCHRLVIDEGGILNGSVEFISPNHQPQNPA